MWFAALFGLGSLAIRPALIESAVMASGFDALVPAAAPPLGVTARMLIALAMGVLGAAIGAVLARRLARPLAPRDAASRRAARESVAEPEADARPGRRFSMRSPANRQDHDDHDEGVAAPALPGRRRALTIDDEGRRGFDDAVPLPGGSPQILDITAFALEDEGDADRPVASWHTDRPAAPFAEEPPVPAVDKPAAPAADDILSPAVVRARVEPLPAASAPLAEDPDPADLLPPRRGGVFALADAAPPLFIDNAAPSVASRPARFTVPTGSAAERIAGADLDALSHVELIERLAISLQRRRDAAAAIAAPPEPVAPAPAVPPVAPVAPFGRLATGPAAEPAPPAPAPLAVESPAADPDIAPAPIPMPAAFRPLSFDSPSDEDEDTDFLAHVPLRSITMPVAASIEDEDDGYASLVDMTVAQTPPRQPLIRIEEPEVPVDAIEPVVIFPGQGARAPSFEAPAAVSPFAAPSPATPLPLGEAPVLRQFDPPGTAGLPQRPANASAPVNDPGEAERALRSALATLQRMNGAA